MGVGDPESPPVKKISTVQRGGGGFKERILYSHIKLIFSITHKKKKKFPLSHYQSNPPLKKKKNRPGKKKEFHPPLGKNSGFGYHSGSGGGGGGKLDEKHSM